MAYVDLIRYQQEWRIPLNIQSTPVSENPPVGIGAMPAQSKPFHVCVRGQQKPMFYTCLIIEFRGNCACRITA